MRFIFNFIFFGILFFAIYLIFPDAFHTMVGWANDVYQFLRDVFIQIGNKIQDWRGQRGGSQSPPQQALFLLPIWWVMRSFS